MGMEVLCWGEGRGSIPVFAPLKCRARYFMAPKVNIPLEIELVYQQ